MSASINVRPNQRTESSGMVFESIRMSAEELDIHRKPSKFLNHLIFGKKGRLIKYNSKYLVHLGWLFPHKGGILSLHQLLVVFLLVVIVTILSYFGCENRSTESFCFPLPEPSTTNLTLLTLSSLILSFFVNNVLQRWWAIRVHLGNVIGRGNSTMVNLMAIVCNAVINTPPSEQKKMKVAAIAFSKKLSSGLIIVFRSVVNSARGQRLLEDLTDQGHITIEEDEYFSSLSGRTLLHSVGYLNTLVHHAAAVGLFGPNPQQLVSQTMVDLTFIRGNGADVGMYLDCQLPYAFVEVVSIVVYAFIVQLVLVSSSYISSGLSQNKPSEMVTGYFTIILYTYVMLGLLNLFVKLENPLGLYANDLPVDTYMKNICDGLEDVRITALRLLEKNLRTGSMNFILNKDVFLTSIEDITERYIRGDETKHTATSLEDIQLDLLKQMKHNNNTFVESILVDDHHALSRKSAAPTTTSSPNRNNCHVPIVVISSTPSPRLHESDFAIRLRFTCYLQPRAVHCPYPLTPWSSKLDIHSFYQIGGSSNRTIAQTYFIYSPFTFPSTNPVWVSSAKLRIYTTSGITNPITSNT
eukprot:gene3269-6472_t